MKHIKILIEFDCYDEDDGTPSMIKSDLEEFGNDHCPEEIENFEIKIIENEFLK